MVEDYDEKNRKTKIYSISICFTLFISGALISSFFFFLKPSNVLCDYTDNKYLCDEKICNKGFFGEKCLECKICQNGYCDGSGTNLGNGKCICNKGWARKIM